MHQAANAYSMTMCRCEFVNLICKLNIVDMPTLYMRTYGFLDVCIVYCI